MTQTTFSGWRTTQAWGYTIKSPDGRDVFMIDGDSFGGDDIHYEESHVVNSPELMCNGCDMTFKGQIMERNP